MAVVSIKNLDIRTYVEQILQLANIEAVSTNSSDVIHIVDVENYRDIEDKNCCLVLGDDSELIDCDAKNSIALPIRAGVLADKIHVMQRQASIQFPENVRIGPYKFVPISMILQNEDTGIEVKLTEKERDLLFFLYTHDGAVVSRRSILQKLWGYADNVETHTLETHFYRLRQKIEADPGCPKILVTSTAGYVLNV